jgi:hypothetical protein
MLSRIKLALVAALALAAVVPAAADEGPPVSRPRHHGYGLYLPPERHVVEVVQPPWSGNFIINGRRFTGVSPACYSWAAGERIRLVEGDWNGRCVQAVFYNLWRHSTCVTVCEGRPWRWW